MEESGLAESQFPRDILRPRCTSTSNLRQQTLLIKTQLLVSVSKALESS